MNGTLGVVQPWAPNFAPRNWTFCEGQLLPIVNYTALFSLLGTTYGGDGRTTFGLPDLRGRVVVGAGQGPGLSSTILGQKRGFNDVTLNTAQMPAHNHAVSVGSSLGAQSGNANQHQPGAGSVLAAPTVQGTPGTLLYSTQAADTDVQGAGLTGSLGLGNMGGGGSHENRQPYLVLRYIICLAGTFPSRN